MSFEGKLIQCSSINLSFDAPVDDRVRDVHMTEVTEGGKIDDNDKKLTLGQAYDQYEAALLAKSEDSKESDRQISLNGNFDIRAWNLKLQFSEI